jgi:putative transposase
MYLTIEGFSPGGNVRPPREQFRESLQTYFVSFQTAQRTPFFQRERWAVLMLKCLASYQEQLHVHDFVIMEDHLHVLMTPDVAVERAVQLIKGAFSFQARRAFEWRGDIWQPGFSDHRIRDAEDLRLHVAYIAKNVTSLAAVAREFCGTRSLLAMETVPQWLKPLDQSEPEWRG